MKPVFQSNKHDPKNGLIGDCLRACICSLLEISAIGVPNFAEDKNYPNELCLFLKERNLKLKCFDTPPIDIEYYMVWGISPRGLKHSVIYCRGVIPNTYVWLEKYK